MVLEEHHLSSLWNFLLWRNLGNRFRIDRISCDIFLCFIRIFVSSRQYLTLISWSFHYLLILLILCLWILSWFCSIPTHLILIFDFQFLVYFKAPFIIFQLFPILLFFNFSLNLQMILQPFLLFLLLFLILSLILQFYFMIELSSSFSQVHSLYFQLISCNIFEFNELRQVMQLKICNEDQGLHQYHQNHISHPWQFAHISSCR